MLCDRTSPIPPVMASSSDRAAVRPRVLMATAHDWGSPLRLGCHHIAAGLANAGCDVAYVSSAISPVQWLRDRPDFRDRLRRRQRGGELRFDGRMWAYVPLALLTPHNAPVLRGRTVHRSWHKTTIPNVVRTVRSHGFGRVDLLYVEAPTQSFWLDDIEHTTSMTRVGDRYAGFQGISDQVLELQKELIRTVDVVACSAEAIVDDVRRLGAKRVLHLPNGVDFEHFTHADMSLPAEYQSIPRPIAVYVGDMAHWFDFALVNQLTERLQGVSFVFIGPDRMAKTHITNRPNVHIIGRRPFEVVPGYLGNADVGLIPFDVANHAELVNAVNPLKLYEYLACGLPVVATRWQELERLNSPATLCDDLDDFLVAIGSLTSNPPDPAVGLAFAEQSSWTNRVQLLLDAIDLGGRGEA